MVLLLENNQIGRKNMIKKMNIKILILIILILTLTVSTVFAGELDNFNKLQTYNNNFIDIKDSDWFSNDVKNSYEVGLFKGKSINQFEPNGNILLSEAITLVSRVHDIYNGGDGVIEYEGSSKEWYAAYVDFAIKNGLFKEKDFADYNLKATRAQIAYLFYNTLDKSDFNKVNDITKLPDVNSHTKYYDEIFALYNAGIIAGSDEYGTFKPNTYISRAETSAIINRVIDKNNRKIINLTKSDGEINIKEINGFKVTSFSTIGEHIATEMLKGNRNIDLRQFNINETVDKFGLTDYFGDLLYEVTNQNPMIFGIDSYTYYPDTKTLAVKYSYDRLYQEQLQNSVSKKVKEVIGNIIEADMTYVEKEIAINNYLCETVEYDTYAAEYFLQTGYISTDIVNSFNAYGALNYGKAVCGGYAQAFKILCDEAGITSIIVTGTLDGVGHEWNRVLIEGKWLEVDVTNNDKKDLSNNVLNAPKQIADLIFETNNYYITDELLNSLERGSSEKYEYYNFTNKYVKENDIYNYITKNLKDNSYLTFRTDSSYTIKKLETIMQKVVNNMSRGTSLSFNTYMGVVYIEVIR